MNFMNITIDTCFLPHDDPDEFRDPAGNLIRIKAQS